MFLYAFIYTISTLKLRPSLNLRIIVSLTQMVNLRDCKSQFGGRNLAAEKTLSVDPAVNGYLFRMPKHDTVDSNSHSTDNHKATGTFTFF